MYALMSHWQWHHVVVVVAEGDERAVVVAARLSRTEPGRERLLRSTLR